MIAKIPDIVKQYQRGSFIALAMLLTAGIGYNIGRISALGKAPSTPQQAGILEAAQSSPLLIKKSTPIPTPKDSRVVASKAAGSKLYHYSWCSGAKQIKAQNQLWFATEAEAIGAGYSLAGNCPDSP